MKIKMPGVMTMKLPPVLFVLACVLLGVVCYGAKTMADNISSETDQIMQQVAQPLPTHPKV
jgi:hypothetical protein